MTPSIILQFLGVTTVTSALCMAGIAAKYSSRCHADYD